MKNELWCWAWPHFSGDSALDAIHEHAESGRRLRRCSVVAHASGKGVTSSFVRDEGDARVDLLELAKTGQKGGEVSSVRRLLVSGAEELMSVERLEYHFKVNLESCPSSGGEAFDELVEAADDAALHRRFLHVQDE